jgi:hypothetical protein
MKTTGKNKKGTQTMKFFDIQIGKNKSGGRYFIAHFETNSPHFTYKYFHVSIEEVKTGKRGIDGKHYLYKLGTSTYIGREIQPLVCCEIENRFLLYSVRFSEELFNDRINALESDVLNLLDVWGKEHNYPEIAPEGYAVMTIHPKHA